MSEETDDELVLRLLKRCAGIEDPLPVTFSRDPKDVQRMNREMTMMQRMIQDGIAEGFIHEQAPAIPGRAAGGRSVGLLGVLPKGMALLAPSIPDFEKEISTLTNPQLEAELKKPTKNLRYEVARKELDGRLSEKTRQEEAEIEKQVLLEVQQRQEALAKEKKSTSLLRNKRVWGIATVVVGVLSVIMWLVPIIQQMFPSNAQPAPVMDPSIFHAKPPPLQATPPPSYFYSDRSVLINPNPSGTPKPATPAGRH